MRMLSGWRDGARWVVGVLRFVCELLAAGDWGGRDECLRGGGVECAVRGAGSE